MALQLSRLTRRWAECCVGAEATLHQVAPYIGKLKSSIARTLVEEFSRPGDIVADPFCGSGVVPLEAACLRRGAVANDINPYAGVLTRAKLFPIPTKAEAMRACCEYVAQAKGAARRTYWRTAAPPWVRQFFHPQTLAETVRLAVRLREDKQWFLLANLLGILHHQRPGFLSYPSSHLVPYLRMRRFPKARYPELYEYRDLETRLIKKLERTYRRFPTFDPTLPRYFREGDARTFKARVRADLILTSPPYMNALDYGRDNRLRLWFVGAQDPENLDLCSPSSEDSFSALMRQVAHSFDGLLKPGGKAILVVGEVKRRRNVVPTDKLVRMAFERESGRWRLLDQVRDSVPDIRRCRRSCRCTKAEWVMVFKKY